MTPRAGHLLFLVVLLATSATWLLVGAGRDANPTEAAAELAAQPADVPAADLAAGEGTPSADAGDQAGGDDARQAQREELPGFPQETGGPTLRVVEATSKRAVPFAEVFVGDASAAWRARRQGDSGPHRATVLERGTPRRADAQGHVTLPPIRRQLMVAARGGSLFGAGVVREDEREPVLELVPDQTLRVRVTDAAGEPVAAVNVSLCADLREPWQQRLQRVSRAQTGSDGVAELRHVQLFAMRVPPPDPKVEQAKAQERQRMDRIREVSMRAQAGATQVEIRSGSRVPVEEMLRAVRTELAQRQAELDGVEAGQPEEERVLQQTGRSRRAADSSQGARNAAAQTWPLADFVVLAEVPQVRPTEARFPAHAIPADVVDLRLLATSSLTVRLLGPDGAALRSPCHVSLRQRRDAESNDARQPTIDQLCTLHADKVLGHGEVTLAPVGLSLRFDVHVEFADNDFNFVQKGVLGPTTPQALEVIVRTPGWFTTVAGRCVDQAGAGIAGLDADLFVAGARGRVEGERVRLEADGSFELPVRLRDPAPPYTLEVQARAGERRLGKLLALPELAIGRRTALGEIALVELPALATGRVQDDLGRPLPGAQVVVHALRRDAWTEESFVRETTDQEGRFALYGEPRALRLRLHARAPRHAPEDRAVTFGERVELTLMRNGAIAAAGYLPAFVPRQAVRVTLTSAAGNSPEDIEVRSRPDQGFELRIDGLRPGIFTLALHVRGLPRPLAVADQVVVQPGATARPAIIDGLDLRGRLFQYIVRGVDQAGKALAQPGSPLLVQLHDASGAPQLVPFAWRGARVEVVTDQPSVSVVGLAAGHRPARALLQPGESTLTFVRVHPLRLVLPGLRALLGPEQPARISLVFSGDTGLPDSDVQAVDQRNGQPRPFARAALGKSSGASLGNGDEVAVTLMLNGAYEIVLRIDGPGGRVSKRIGTVAAVLDGPTPPSATVHPDIDAVRDAIAELRARPATR